MDVQEVRKLDAYLKRVFGNPKIRVVPRPKKDDSAEVYIGEEFIGVLFVDDEDDDRSFQFQMAILEEDLADVGEADVGKPANAILRHVRSFSYDSHLRTSRAAPALIPVKGLASLWFLTFGHGSAFMTVGQ